jgi:gliding motility-associated-like protein
MKNYSQTSLKLKFILGLLSLLFVNFSYGQGGPSLDLGNNQIICTGSNTATVAAATNNLGALTVSSYAWTVEGVNAGTSFSTSITVNASLSPNNPQDVNCMATLSDGSTINDNMSVFTISPGVIAGDQFSCSAPYNPNAFTSTSGGTTSLSNISNFSHTYQWESATNVNGPWTSISGATSATYDPSNLSSTTYFRRVLEVTIGNSNPITESCTSNVLTVQILNAPTISNNQCIANGATANMSVSFNPALPSGYTATYSWSGPSSYTSSSATATVSNFGPSKQGTYTANISITNGTNSCTYSLSTQLNLIPNTPTFSIPATGCPGSSFTPSGFTPQTTPSTINYQWSISPSNGSSTGLNGTTPNFLFNSGGTYSISVTATNSSGGCSAISSSNTISIPSFSSENPTVGVGGSFYNPQIINGVNTIAICAGLSVSAVTIFNNNTINNGGLNPAGVTYTYSLNGSAPSAILDNISQTIYYGNNNLIINANYQGCTLTNTVNVYSGSNPFVSLGTSNSIGLCPGNALTFTINPIPLSGQVNPPGTSYTMTYSDSPGTSNVFNDIAGPTSVSHNYLATSCGMTYPGGLYPANTFYAQVTAQNYCGQTSSTVSPITVNDFPIANFTVTDSTICANQSITVTNTGDAGSVVGNNSPYNCNDQGKFYWTITGGVMGVDYTVTTGVLGFFNNTYNNPNGSVNTVGNGSSTLNITFNTPGTYTITQHYHNGCGTKTKVRNICVINPPTCQFTATPSSGCTPLTVAINNTTVAPTCGGTPIPLTYAWTVTSPTGTTASYTTSTAQAPGNLVLTNPTSTPQTYTISLTVTPKDPYSTALNFGNPNCTSTCTQTVTVNPKPTYTPVNITTCNDPYTAAINLQAATNIANSTFSWQASANTNVIGESTTAQTTTTINDILDNTATSPQTVSYTITPTSPLGCVGNAATSTILLNYVDAGVISSNITVCNGADPSPLTGTTPVGTGTVSYQWQSSTNGGTTWNNITPNGTSANYDPPAGISTNTCFRRIVNFNSNNTNCQATSNSICITVNTVNPGTISAAQNLCTGDDPAALNVVTGATGTGATTYIWQQSSNATGPWTSISGQTGTSYDPAVLGSTTYFSISATSVLNGVSCSLNTPAIAVNVYSLTPGSISSSQTICTGGDPTTFTSTPATTNAPLVAYQWQISTDNSSWTNITSATSATYDPPALTTTTYYRRLVNVLIGSTVICQGQSNTITVTVIPDPTVSAPTGQTICTGGSPTALSVSASGGTGSNYSYLWFNSSGVSQGVTTSTFTPPATNASYYCQVSISPAASTGCSVNSSSAQITVVADPVVTAPTSASYCQDAASVSALSVTASGGLSSTYNYQWFVNTVNNNTNGTLISGATSATFTPPVNIVGIRYYYCVVSILPNSTGCSTTSAIATITVTAGPSVSSQPANQTRCIGGTFTALSVATSGGSGTPTYQWYSNTANSNNGGTLITGATNTTFTVPSNLSATAGVTYYYCVISFSATGGCSVISSNAAALTVLATPTVNPIPNQVFCKNTVAPATPISANYSSGMTYTWSVTGSSVGLTPTAGSTSTIPSFTTVNNGTAPLTATVNITPTYTTGSLVCAGNPTSAFTITVNPRPVMQAFNPLLYVFCENTTGFVPFSANISSGMSYSWTNDNTQIGVGATGTSTSPGLTFTTVNNLSNPNQPLTSNFMVTPVYTNGGVSCPGTAVPFAITINPLPDVIPLPDYTICATSTGSNQFSSLNPIVGLGTTYAWSNSNLAIGMAASGNGSHFFTATNTSLVPITGTVSVTPTYTNNGVTCTGTPDQFVITVNPMPTVNPITSQGLCVGSSTAAVTPTGNIPGTVYTWSNNNTSTGLAASGNTLIPDFIGQNTTNAPNVSTVSVVPSYTYNNITCTGTAGQFGITINPTPNVNPITDQQVCAQYNTTVQFTSSPNIVGTVYNWTNNNTAIGLSASGTGALSFNATNTTTAPITATITVTPSFTSAGSTCWGAPETFEIVVLPTPVMNPLSNQTVCSGNPSTVINFSSNLTGTQYAWTNSNSNIGLLSSGSGSSIGAFNTTNTGSAPAQGLISVTPSLVTNNQTCSGSPVTALITVNPIPVMTSVSNPSFCYGAAANIPLSSNINTGVVYNWTNSNTAIGLGALGTGNISFTTNNTNSTPISGLISVSPVYTNNNVQCTGNSSSFTIQVAPNPLVNPIGNQVFCSGTQSTIIPIGGTVTGASYSWTNANTAIGLQATGTGNIPVFNTANSSTTSVASSLVTVSPSLLFNGQTCTGPSTTFSIQINPGTTINTVPNVQLCNGETSVAINFSGSGSNYTWANNSTSIGLASSGTGGITPFTAINTGSTPVIATITVTSQFSGGGTGCNGGSTTFNIQVLPTPSVVDPPNLVVCSGTTVNAVNLYGVATNYTWTNSAPSIGLTNTGTTATIPAFTATNTGTSSVLATVNISPSYVSGTKVCTGTSQSYTINVIPLPTITSQPQSQTVCLGGSLSNLSVAYSGGNGTPTYQWFSSPTNSTSNGSAIIGATSASYTLPAASAVGTTYYYCTLTFANAATCSTISSNLAAITITSGPSISTQPLASQSICVGGSIPAALNVAFFNGTGNATIQWFSVNGGTNTAISGANTTSYLPGVFNTVGTYSYMAQISLSGSGCGLAQSNTVQVIVLADPTITSPTPASYCLNSSTAVPLSITANGGTSTPYAYQWYSNSVNNNTSGTLISGATAASYIPATTAVATTYYYCVVSQGNGCSVSSNAAAIAVTSAPSISSQPFGTQTVCLDGAVSALSVAYASGSGTPSYQWYSNSSNSYVGGVAIPGAAGSSYVPLTNLVGTTYYFCVITFASSGCSSISSNISQIVVVADPVVTTQPLTTQTICGGGSIPNALNVAYSGGTGTLSYQWFSVNGTTNTLIGGATAATYLPPAFATPGTYNFAVQISLSGSGCNMVQSNNAQVIVLTDPTVTAPLSATYCNGYAPVQALLVAPSGGLSSGFNYQWYSNSVNSNTSGTLIASAAASNYTPPVTANGSVYYYCVVSQGAANTGCSIASATALIITSPAPAIATQPTTMQTACVGGTLNNLTVTYTGASTTPSYQWYSNATNANTGGTPIPGANASSYLPQNTTAGTVYYYCVISFPAISCTTISSNPGGVTIHPDPIISVQPIANQAICFGTTLNAPLNISYTGGFGTPSYQWNMINGGVSTAIQNATNATYLPGNFNLAGTYNFNVTLTLSGNGCNVQTSNQAQVIVMPVPIVDSVGSALYCNADTAAMVVFSGPIAGTTYIWSNDNPGIGLAASGFGNIMPFEVTNMNNFGIIGNISVTPQLTTLNTTCSGTPVDFTIMVNPYQDVQDPQDLVLCHGTGVNGVQFFGSALINNWTNDLPALGIPAAGSGTLPAFLAVNNGTQPIVAHLSVTPSFNAVTTCPGDIETFTITILPNPNVSVTPASQTICSGDLSATINMSGTATSFAWTNNQTSIGLAANGTGNIPAFLTNATGSNTTSTIAVTPVYTFSGLSCPGPSQNVQITVVPTPSVLPLPDLVYCNGDATNLIQILGNANELNWSSSNPSIGTAAIGSGSIPSFNVINPTQSPVSSVITVTPVNFFAGLTCMAPAEDFSITINPTPTINPIADQVLCAQSNSPAMLFSGNANNFVWTNSNNAIGLASSGTGNISSFVTQNTLPSVATANVSVTPQFTNAGLTCQGAPELFVIDVLPVPTMNTVSPQVLCNGTATAPITFTGNATSYSWINNNVSVGLAGAGSGDIPGFNAVGGATNNVANLVITPTYTYNNTTCVGTPGVTTITVLPSPFINTVQDVVACNGNLSGIIAFSGTANTFNWTNSNPSIGLAANGSGNLPVFTNTNTSSNPLLATITVTPQTGQGNQACEGTPEIFTITVNPTPTMLPPGSQVLCSQTQTQPVNFTGNATSYSWLNSNTSIGLASFGNGAIPAFNAQNNGLNTQIAQIQVTPQYVNAGTTCLGTPQNFTFSVDPIPTVQYSQISQTVCTGSGTTAVNLSSQTPGVVYSWDILNPSGAITGIPSMNGTGNVPSMTLVNSGNTNAQFNFQGMAVTPLASCIGYGPLGTISVAPAPVMQPLNDLTICSNSLINYSLVASLPSTFSWTASTNTNVVGQPTSAVNSNLIFNTLQNNAATLQYVTYTVTPTSFPTGCIGQPETFIAEVVPNIQITSVANYEICSGEPTDITLVSNLPGNFTYTATNNPNVQGESSNTQPGFYINDILSNNTAYDQIVSYSVQVVSNPSGCFGLPQIVNVEVHPEISITNASPTQMCSGSPLNLNLTATENATFSWYATQNGLVNGESTASQSNAILNDNLVLEPNVNTHQTVQYTISATSTVTGCDAQALPLSIIVNPVPVVSSLADQLLCSGESTDPLNWTLNGTATNYAWSNTNSSIGLALNGNGNIPSFNVTNVGPQTANATITVIPQYINNGFVCAGTVDTLTFTVEPIPSIAYSTPNQDLCSGDLSDTIAMSSPTSGAILTWEIINPPLAISGIPNLTGNDSIPGMYLSNSSTSAQQILFQGTATTPLNGCTTLGPIGQIVVLPEPVVTSINDLTICSGDIVSQNINSSIPSTFVWGAQSNPNVNGESVGPVNSNFIYNSLQNTSSSIQYVDYTITPTSILGGCVGADLDFTVEVIPDITLNTAVTPLFDSICSGELTSVFLQTNYPANIVWHALPNPNVSGETTIATAGAYISDILVNNTPFNQYVTYYIDMLSTPNACQGVPQTITILVFPAIQLTNATNLNLCSTDTLDLSLAATVNATFTWYATNNGVVQGETTTPQNTSLINDILVNNSALTEQVNYAVDVVADISGCVAYDLPITVNVLPLPILLNNDTTICSGENTNINLVTNIPASIIWNGVFNIPIIGETYANISGTYINDLLINDSGQDDTLVYEVSATANGCTAPLDSVLVIVHDQPDIDFSIATNPLCSEDTIQFTNLSNPNFDFDWSFGDGGTSVAYSPIHIYNNSGIYEVMLVGTNPLNNCSAADSTTIIVNKMPDASFYTMDTIGCGNLNATFYANYQATSDMVWDFGDGQSLAQVGNVTNYYGQAGCYDVTLTVTSPEGCVAQESYDDYVCVYENPIAFIGASPTSVNALNPTVQFSNSSQNAISYIWQMGDGGISYDDNPTYTYPMEGADYYVLMTAFNEVGCFDTASIDIHVFEELIFYVPNTFTPNDDEKNQTFYPVLSQGMKRTYMEFYIYNRWGELVFESHDPSYGWDGTYGPDALDCPIGTYTWKLKLETLQTQEILDFHGHVNLIR